MIELKLYRFKPQEFIRGGVDWFYQINPRLLVILDLFAIHWVHSVEISPANGAVGRMSSSGSQHSMSRGDIRAVDVLPDGIHNREDAMRCHQTAVDVGFTGIGFAPLWKPKPGFHLDVRHERYPGQPVTWGYGRDSIGRQIEISLSDAFELMEE